MQIFATMESFLLFAKSACDAAIIHELDAAVRVCSRVCTANTMRRPFKREEYRLLLRYGNRDAFVSNTVARQMRIHSWESREGASNDLEKGSAPHSPSSVQNQNRNKEDSPAASQDDDTPTTNDRHLDAYGKDSLEVSWDGPADPMNPQSMRKTRKWIITMTIAFSSFCVTANSSLYTTTYDQLIPRFHTTREVTTLGLSTFVWGLMVGSVFLGSG